ncbi:MAG TPA: serine/threonine-protein kinase [Gemmatimonadaceae bacterium]|nr:serine/threonine-protein kinase [Gemmatimonadaceae bacterium]
MSREQLQQRLQAALGDAYAIERELPRGGMSRVFLALENALHRHVVLKVLSPDVAATLSTERFKREISLAARLQHPHIVPLLNAGVAGGYLYYTMPWVDGESLRERMARQRLMPALDVARILEEVAGALDYAHSEGIIHRDIKPENVMFFHERAVVLDFGIGKALSASVRAEDDVHGRITQSGMSLGTPAYISPEQASGDPDLDHRTDLYALGVVAYEMLTGHQPFTGKSPQAVMAAHAKQDPEPIERRRGDVPTELRAIVMRCLAKRPSDRPARAGDIVQAIGHTPAAGTRTAPAGSLLARVPVWVPWAIAALATALALFFALRRPP